MKNSNKPNRLPPDVFMALCGAMLSGTATLVIIITAGIAGFVYFARWLSIPTIILMEVAPIDFQPGEDHFQRHIGYGAAVVVMNALFGAIVFVIVGSIFRRIRKYFSTK
jgi:hypothetical protein